MKTISEALAAGLAAGTIIPRLFLRGYFGANSDDVKGFWPDAQTVTVGGVAYEGAGSMVGISAIGGVSDLSAPGLKVTFSGLSPKVLDSFFEEVWHQKPMALDIGFLSPDTRDLLDDPTPAFAGYMDEARRRGGGKKQAKLEVSCEDASWRLNRIFTNVRSDADQRSRSSTDTLLSRLAVAGQRTTYWGEKTPVLKKK